AALTVGAHLANNRRKRLAEGFVEFRAVGGAAHGVQFQRPASDTYAVEQRREQFENFRVPGGRLAARRGRADHLGSDLVELAIAAFLRALAAELRSDIEELVEAAI